MTKDNSLRDEALPPVIHAQRTVWQGFRRLDVIDGEVRASEARGSRLDHEIVRVGRIAAVLPYDPVRGRIMLIRQFRMGAHLATGLGLNVEVIAGRVDAGETVEAAALREAREEGGVTLTDIVPMLSFAPVPAALDEFGTLFVGRADLDHAPDVTGLAEEQEVILPLITTPEAALQAARDGRLANGYTLLALAWFTLHRSEIDRRWMPK